MKGSEKETKKYDSFLLNQVTLNMERCQVYLVKNTLIERVLTHWEMIYDLIYQA
jgi:hypothetical protein